MKSCDCVSLRIGATGFATRLGPDVRGSMRGRCAIVNRADGARDMPYTTSLMHHEVGSFKLLSFATRRHADGATGARIPRHRHNKDPGYHLRVPSARISFGHVKVHTLYHTARAAAESS